MMFHVCASGLDEEQEVNFSGGLVEIAALTAVIGGSTAELIALGNRGACGLPWAALSSFGSIFIVKACISACTPGWLRDTVGVRTSGSDKAIGCCMNLNRKSNSRVVTGSAVGVTVKWTKTREGSTLITAGSEDFEDVYAFDEWTAGPLRSCTVMQPGEHLQAHVYMRDHYWEIAQRSQTKYDWIVTFATMLKVIEMYLLYHFGSRRVFLVTGAIWAYTFFSAIALQLFHVGRATTPGEQSRHFDVVSGSLPTPQVIGGERRILLGAPVNLRRGRAWQMFWILGAVVCVTSLLATYAVLSNEPAICFRIWLGFQVIWLALRSIFFHFAQQVDDMKHIITPTITDENRPPELSLRLLGLAVGVSRHQTLNHPRGVLSYANDAQDPVTIRMLLRNANFDYTDYLELPTRTDPGSELNVTVVAVIGDTLLSSVAWLMGSPLSGMDLYDSCILAVRVSGAIQLIPSCRVLSGRIADEQVPDPETTLPSNFRPKGAANEGYNISWRYWMPCGGKMWLWYSTPWATTTKVDLGITGTKKMTVTTGDDITKELLSGTLQISMSDVQAVEDAIAQSARAATILRNMLREDFTTLAKSVKS